MLLFLSHYYLDLILVGLYYLKGSSLFLRYQLPWQARYFRFGSERFRWNLAFIFNCALGGIKSSNIFCWLSRKGLYTLCGGRNKTEIEIIRTKPVPRPRVRKNVMEEDDLDDEFEEDIEDYLEDEDYEEREIKVSRRGDRVNRKELAKSVKQFIKSRQEASRR